MQFVGFGSIEGLLLNNTSAIRNNDGTVTFVFKQTCVAVDVNCLEVLTGRFDLAAYPVV